MSGARPLLPVSQVESCLGVEMELLTPNGQPLVEVSVVEDAKALAKGNPLHTGSTAVKDIPRAQQAYMLLIAGVSRRRIAEALRMSRHTLDRVEEAFEAAGKLAPLKERAIRQLAALYADAADEARDMVLAPGAKGVDEASWLKSLAMTLDVGFKNHSLSTGQATSISVQRTEIDADQVRGFLRDAAAAVDVESVVAPLTGNELRDCETVIEAAKGADSVVDVALRGAGGGSSAAAGGDGTDGSGVPKFLSKDERA